MKRIAIGLVAVVACSDSRAPVTCQALAAAADCVAQQATALAACMPMRATMATAVNASTCMFSDGVTVAFTDPLRHIGGLYPTPIAFTVVSPDGTPCGYLRSDAEGQDPMSLEVIGELPVAGAMWSHNASRGTLDLVCGTAQQHYDTDLVDAGCTVAEPAFTSPQGQSNPYIFTLATAATSGELFTCR